MWLDYLCAGKKLTISTEKYACLGYGFPENPLNTGKNRQKMVK